MKSKLFETMPYQQIENDVQLFLNKQQAFLSEQTAKSTRAVGDALQDILGDHFTEIIGENHIKNYSSVFARRAMADMAFEDYSECYYIVDVKTHRLNTKFNMPNITSVERIARFYEDDKNYFVVLMVVYDIEDINVKVKKVHFVPIEYLDWSCLTIGALGWGQIQIANSNNIVINPQTTRKQWMLSLCDILVEQFYPREVTKIDVRIKKFQQIRTFWENHPD